MAEKETRDIDVLVIGESGSGKSTMINTLLGIEEWKTGKTLYLNGFTRQVKRCSGILPMNVYESMDEDSRNQPRASVKDEPKTSNEDNQNVDKHEDEANGNVNKSTSETKLDEMEGMESRKDNFAKTETEQRKHEDKTKEKINQCTAETKSEELEEMKSRRDHIAKEETKKGKSGDETKSNEMEGMESRKDNFPKTETEQRKHEDEREEKIITSEIKLEDIELIESRKYHLAKQDSELRKNEDEAKDKMNKFTSETKSGKTEGMKSRNERLAKQEKEQRKNEDETKEEINMKLQEMESRKEGFVKEENEWKTKGNDEMLDNGKFAGKNEKLPCFHNKEKTDESLLVAKYDNINLKEIEKLPVNLYDTPAFDKVVTHFPHDKGFHAIALMFPMTRYTEERQKFLKRVHDAFGETLYDHIIIIFTKHEEQGGLKEIKEQIKMVHDRVLSSIIENSGERCIIFGSPAKSVEERQKFILEFSEKLKDVLDHTENPITLKQRYISCCPPF